MFGLSAQHRFYFYTQPTDMRKGCDGLCGIIRNKLNADPFSGEVFIFLNRTRNRMKILIWDLDGFLVYYKRLEKGTFEWPKMEENQLQILLNWDTLMFILRGISLEKIVRKKRYKRA